MSGEKVYVWLSLCVTWAFHYSLSVIYVNKMSSYYWLICVLDRQVWAVNSAGHSASAWTSGRTGPAPPEGVGLPVFLRVSATSAVVDIHPPARPNGIVSLYRVFSLNRNNHTLVKNVILLLIIHSTRMEFLLWFLNCLPLQSSILHNYILLFLWSLVFIPSSSSLFLPGPPSVC